LERELKEVREILATPKRTSTPRQLFGVFKDSEGLDDAIAEIRKQREEDAGLRAAPPDRSNPVRPTKRNGPKAE
jgi:hypothetical protein